MCQSTKWHTNLPKPPNPCYAYSMENQKTTQTTQMTATLVPTSFTQATQEKIEELLQDAYAQEDMYDFIVAYGEEQFVNYYEQYVDLGETFNYEAVDAFLENFDLADLEHFEDAFFGAYESEAQFAEDIAEQCGETNNLPAWIVIDWQASWDCNLRHDYIFEDGFIFNKNF